MTRRVSILGVTGSVGRKAADLVAGAPDRFVVQAVTANSDVAGLAAAATRLGASVAVIADAARHADLRDALAGTGVEAAAGAQALVEAASRPAEVTLAAIVGASGLAPTLAAAQRGGVIALANKEALVCAGHVLMNAVAASGAVLLPVDSEHNAIFQVFAQRETVERLILTASGGPFWTSSLADMRAATPEQAVAHPVWSMGAKISVDSATMMNKGLEIIEAAYLFDMPHQRIDVLVHPQAVVHSMVEYRDGSVLAQMGTPDMATPIAFALSWPDRMPAAAERLDLTRMADLTFAAPDPERFPALDLARHALELGGAGPIVLNAANEAAVEAFLARRLGFTDIARLVEQCLSEAEGGEPTDLEAVLALDFDARSLCRRAMKALA